MIISVITVCFNSDQFIGNCIQTVLQQENANIELIIVDGGSTDNTLPIIRSFNDNRIRWVSEPDKGIYDAMNKGIGMARGEIIGILNSDDFYADNNVLERVGKCLEQNPGADGVYSDLVYVDRFQSTLIKRTWRAGGFQKRKFFFGWMPPHPTVFFRRKVYDEIGLFNVEFKSAADYELLLRACVKSNKVLAYIPEVLVKMRIGGISNASLRNRLHANREDYMAWKENGLTPKFFTTFLKPIRKINQFFSK